LGFSSPSIKLLEISLKYIRESELNDPKHFADFTTSNILKKKIMKLEAELELIESMNLVEWLTENYN